MLKKSIGLLCVMMLIMTWVLSVCSMDTYKHSSDLIETVGASERSIDLSGKSPHPRVQTMTDHFSNSVVIITGKSNTVSSTALWLFGLKCMVLKRVTIQANNLEGENINALILPPQIGVYFDYENIYIQMQRVTGLFFWGKRSLIFEGEPPQIFAVCKARDIWVTYA